MRLAVVPLGRQLPRLTKRAPLGRLDEGCYSPPVSRWPIRATKRVTTSIHQTAKVVVKDKSGQAPRFLPLETIEVHFRFDERRLQTFGIVSNMSETGGCIITNRDVPLDSKVTLEIRRSRASTLLEETAWVVWCAERMEPVKEIVGYLTGVRFDKHAQPSIKALLSSGIFQLIP